MQDFAIRLSDRPGELARVATALSRYGVNIKSVAGLAADGQVVVRILADNADAARSAFKDSQIPFDDDEVISVLLENRAGKLASVCQKLGDARVNLKAIYLTGIVDDLVELAIVPDNPGKARDALRDVM
jgi:hypothetical protein